MARPVIHTPMQRWAAKVQLPADPDGCWEWSGYRSKGYGRFWPGGKRVNYVRKNNDVFAYRWGYERFIGEVPDGLQLDHLCRNPGCVNPAHLEAVTPQVNMLRGKTLAAANAAKTHCHRGHELVGNNLLKGAPGRRACLECSRIRKRGYRQRDAISKGGAA